MHSYKQNFGKLPYRDIKVTLHAKQRAYERLGLTKETDIQKLAHAAKYKGVKIHELTRETYKANDISYDMYCYLKNHFGRKFKSERMYYYKNFVYIFAGNRSRCLKSIVPCTYDDMIKAVTKLDRTEVCD